MDLALMDYTDLVALQTAVNAEVQRLKDRRKVDITAAH